jgi:nicotinamide mononucleotide transporter
MKEIIDFFSAPYTGVTAFHITLEIVAVFFGIASVLYAKKRKHLGVSHRCYQYRIVYIHLPPIYTLWRHGYQSILHAYELVWLVCLES